jgi:hypothetical protein
MKKHRILFLIITLLSAGILLKPVSADPPSYPPPPPGGGHGGEGNQPPAGAPIDGGTGILLVLGAAYAGNKLYLKRKDKR